MDYQREHELKEIIRQYTDDNFVDALYEGTTSETTVVGFERAMEVIAQNCHLPEFGIKSARFILENYNPGKEYRGDLFESYAVKSAIR